MGTDDYEYAVWVLLRDRLGHWPTIRMAPPNATAEDWKGIKGVVILDPQLLEAVLSSEPTSNWRTQKFGSITVQCR
jgi:hypothetical protein